MQHFDIYDVLSDNQHGFCKRRSCETQFLTTIQEIASNTAKRETGRCHSTGLCQSFWQCPSCTATTQAGPLRCKGQHQEMDTVISIQQKAETETSLPWWFQVKHWRRVFRRSTRDYTRSPTVHSLMTSQIWSNRRPLNCLVMTAQSSGWSRTTMTDSSTRKTSQHWNNGKILDRWASTPLSALSSGSPLDFGKSSTLPTVSMATHLRWWSQVNTLESPSQKASPGRNKHIRQHHEQGQMDSGVHSQKPEGMPAATCQGSFL